ncbi:chorismate mutase [Parvibaculum sp.]|uniref:chorismate mutase n=1 Tax=Parvibaculum sp. TaxID=2024848 RepID=UPI001B26A40D|nr:chorismate mutase [Parvibaculum sp.]MBO6633195.1 chorismate mutase [Parvibaculum sp.]MBO6677122.1 chorismate mutase [Parvibaculum sp.]MBO6683918.1 chorismate mutase [Parvibaculum sp.]MBO6904292.1 chorismate mutase [Parvibaculum sp.]
MTTETTTPDKALADVRKEIDAIDDALQDLLMKRTELVVEVAEAKARAASAAGQGSFVAFRPGREAEVLRRLAERHEGRLPLRVLVRLWREIMAAMTRIQGPFRVDVFGGSGSEALGFWDLARNYYGSTTPMDIHDDAREVLRRVGHDRSAIGILPQPGMGMGDQWWVAFATGGYSDIRIVARLPFIDVEKEDDGAQALVLAHSNFESTGDDTALLALSTTESLSDSRVATLVKAAGIEGRRIASAKIENGAAKHIYLIELPHHLAEDDERLAALDEEPVAEVRLLGGYANPLRLARDGE